MELKGGLGKGLSALFEQKQTEEQLLAQKNNDTNDKSFFELEISKINLNPYQPREDFDKDKLIELAESIKQKGIIQPVTVKLSADNLTYDLISGERRIKAARLCKLDKVPAYLYKTTDQSEENMLELALIENIQREDLNAMELADSYQKLMNDCGLTQEQVADKVAKKRSTVANFLRLHKLPEEIKQSLRKSEISEAHARTLLRMETPEEQISLWKRILSDNISVRKLEEITKSKAKPKKKKELKQTENSAYNMSVEDKLRQFFGTRVQVKSKTKFTGEIIIDYYSEDDLERIIDKCE